MPVTAAKASDVLLDGLNDEQSEAVRSRARRLLVVAGAGSGKTEVMARRVAWWIAVDRVPKDQIVAFTFTEAAAKELKFRIRGWLQKIASPTDDPRLGGMYIGTIHGFCLKMLREHSPDEFYMFDVVDDAGRMSLIERGYNSTLGLTAFQRDSELPKFRSIDLFLKSYDLLNEYGLLQVELAPGSRPNDVSEEREWCKQARLLTNVGESKRAHAFSRSAGRYYAYLRARRFLDFGTIQSETVKRLQEEPSFLESLTRTWRRLVVDEVQDINPVQDALIRAVVGESGHLTAVGDHRQAIYSFRGGRVDLMGDLYKELVSTSDGHVQELPANYRSTPRIIDLANRWSDTIGDSAEMANPAMEHRRLGRRDRSELHLARVHFRDRASEAEWIAATVAELVRCEPQNTTGAFHDKKDGPRGLALADIAVLVRSGTDIRAYQDALRSKGLPAVVRGGPDLFSQPEVLLFLGALGICAGLKEFWGSQDPRSMPARVRSVLGVEPIPTEIVPAALSVLRDRGLSLPPGTGTRLQALCRAIQERLSSDEPLVTPLNHLNCSRECRRWLTRRRRPRRIFPQTIYHWLLREAAVHSWSRGTGGRAAEGALFHVGQLSSLVKAMESSGWTPTDSLKWQLIALLSWGASSARPAEAELLAGPDAVTVTTIHSAKGLQFGAVFLADVCARRFPSGKARSVVNVAFDKGAADYVDPEPLSDNENYDNERRLMYVALTRAERYLYVTASGKQQSQFFRSVGTMIQDVGGTLAEEGLAIADSLSHFPSEFPARSAIATSFSDLRYFLECPQDFLLRNVLGYAPTIGQEFGYGRGLHNLLRIVHSNPRYWAELASNPARLRSAVDALMQDGTFYLRYTVGNPLKNLQNRAAACLVEYVETYADELARLEFEPEKEFEVLIAEEDLLVAGAIDLVRLDDPPRVSIVDFKSGNSDAETGSGLSRELMALQVGVYGLAAREELEYEPEKGLIRYLGEPDPKRRQAEVSLTDSQLQEVRQEFVRTARSIRERRFDQGPTGRIENRCAHCDFLDFCPRPEAEASRG